MVQRWRSALAALAAVAAAAAGCGEAAPPDTAAVLLSDVRLGGDPWRLEGRRLGGRLCAELWTASLPTPVTGRCGLERTPLRHLDPVTVTVGGRLVLFSALPSAARRVRIDGADGSLHIEPARTAAGFPGRWFLISFDPAVEPVTVRIFADGGRAVVA